MNPKQKTETLKVRATQAGYFGDGPMGQIYRYVGDVFTIAPRTIELVTEDNKPILDAEGNPKTKTLSCQEQFSGLWMEIVSDMEPERLTTAGPGLVRAEQERQPQRVLA